MGLFCIYSAYGLFLLSENLNSNFFKNALISTTLDYLKLNEYILVYVDLLILSIEPKLVRPSAFWFGGRATAVDRQI